VKQFVFILKYMSFPKRVIIPKSLPHGVHGGNFTLLHSTIMLQYWSHVQNFFQNWILFTWCAVIIITHIHQQMHTFYIESQSSIHMNSPTCFSSTTLCSRRH